MLQAVVIEMLSGLLLLLLILGGALFLYKHLEKEDDKNEHQ